MQRRTFCDWYREAERRASTVPVIAPFGHAAWGFDIHYSPAIDIGDFDHEVLCIYSVAVDQFADWWICAVTLEGCRRASDHPLALACAAAALADIEFARQVEDIIRAERAAA